MSDSDIRFTLAADASGVVQGVGEAKSAIANFAPQVDVLAKSFDGLAGHVKDGFDGVKSLASGLKQAAAGGAEGLAGIAEAGGGATLAIGAVVEAALGATSAMAGWASSTLKSSSASAEAKQNAADLVDAFGQAQTAFKNAGDTLANALAPALTQLVGGIADVVQKAGDFYNHSTVLKTGLDWLVVGLKATFVPIETLGLVFAEVWDAVKHAGDSFAADFEYVKQLVLADIDAMGAGFKSFALAVANALAGNWAGAAQAGIEGVNQAMAAAERHSADLATAHARVAAVDKAWLVDGKREADNYAKGLNDLFNGPNAKGLPSARARGHAGDYRSSGGGRARSSGGQDTVQQQMQAWSEQWRHTADMAVVISDNANLDLLQAEIKFWAQKLGLAKQGSEEWFAVLEKLNPLVAQQQREQTNETKRQTDEQVRAILEGLNKEIEAHKEAARKNVEEQKKAAEAAKRAWDRSIGAIIQDFGRGLLSIAEGTESFSQLMRKIGQKILTDWVNNISKMVSEWVRANVAKLVSTNTTNAAITASNQTSANANLLITLETNLKKIVSDAKTAAGNAYTWASSWGGPIAGAAAAAAAFAGVMAFSAKGGYDIPAGVNPLTQLHAQEMVLPARLANPMREMLASFGSGSAPAAGGHSFSFGDTHIHGAPNMSPSDFKQALAEHRASVAQAVASALHGGWRPSYRQPVGAL